MTAAISPCFAVSVVVAMSTLAVAVVTAVVAMTVTLSVECSQ